ncbi:lipocalin family protein [Gordonia humi]|uniref:Apolipoprotein D and lipocalin family protein n=1 Tax=Gordonia humi TaxID=686429 RepID=A0A840F2F5_9ACTN|nr:lipocalin family protein [Gordonia humi]MBB4133757.1 apolipoprotein D and lipocalin family protein [Gordonia humi]
MFRRTLVTLFLTVIAASAALIVPSTVRAAPLRPVAQVDLNRYLGVWHQLAANPAPFNIDCVRDTTAEYSSIDARTVRVKNSCTSVTGAHRSIVGRARVNGPAALHVSFPGVPTQESVSGPSNYLIAYIAPDYSWALVGDPSRLSGFVLSRSGRVDHATWRTIVDVVERKGYNPCLMVTSPVTGGYRDIRPLCTV